MLASYKKYKTAKGYRWEVRVRKAGFSTVTRTFDQKASAKRWALKTEHQLENGLAPISFQNVSSKQLLTVKDLLQRYLQEVAPTKKGYKVEAYRLARLLQNPLANLSLRKLGAHHLAQYRDERIQLVGNGTVLKELALLSTTFEIARTEWGVPLPLNPVSIIRKPKQPHPRERRFNKNEDEEERLLSEAAKSTNSWFLPILKFAIETGMRRGEILSLTLENVHLDKRFVHLPDTKNGDSRDVPLSPMALELLSALPRNIRGDQFVFPLHFEALKSLWRRACSRADISDLRFHDLRHEATSRLFEKGLNVMEVAAITGHKDLRMLQRYTHLRAEELALKLN